MNACSAFTGTPSRVSPGRTNQLRHRHRAEPLQRLPEPRGGPRDPARGRADVEDLRNVLAEVDRERDPARSAARPRPAGNGDEEVEQHVLVRGVDEHEPAGPQPGERALGDEGGQHRRHRGVDRVPALAKDGGPGLGGERMSGRDCPSRAHGGAAVGAGQPPGTNSGTSIDMSRGRDSKLGALPALRSAGRRTAVAVVPAARSSARALPSARRPRPSKRVAMTVTQSWSASVSSTLAPKMMLASGGRPPERPSRPRRPPSGSCRGRR